jgi:hypothetical protein
MYKGMPTTAQWHAVDVDIDVDVYVDADVHPHLWNGAQCVIVAD